MYHHCGSACVKENAMPTEMALHENVSVRALYPRHIP
jgi:hypothetical protein